MNSSTLMNTNLDQRVAEDLKAKYRIIAERGKASLKGAIRAVLQYLSQPLWSRKT